MRWSYEMVRGQSGNLFSLVELERPEGPITKINTIKTDACTELLLSLTCDQ